MSTAGVATGAIGGVAGKGGSGVGVGSGSGSGASTGSATGTVGTAAMIVGSGTGA
jgi:hypothetical protein